MHHLKREISVDETGRTAAVRHRREPEVLSTEYPWPTCRYSPIWGENTRILAGIATPGAGVLGYSAYDPENFGDCKLSSLISRSVGGTRYSV